MARPSPILYDPDETLTSLPKKRHQRRLSMDQQSRDSMYKPPVRFGDYAASAAIPSDDEDSETDDEYEVR